MLRGQHETHHVADDLDVEKNILSSGPFCVLFPAFLPIGVIQLVTSPLRHWATRLSRSFVGLGSTSVVGLSDQIDGGNAEDIPQVSVQVFPSLLCTKIQQMTILALGICSSTIELS